MKARKVLAHQLLVGEVLSQLAFFQPNPRVCTDMYIIKMIVKMLITSFIYFVLDNQAQARASD